MRIKVDIRKLFVNVFEHTPGAHRQLLFFKERFLPSDYPDRKKMEVVSQRLRKMGVNESNVGHGFTKREFEQALEKAGLTKVLTKKGI